MERHWKEIRNCSSKKYGADTEVKLQGEVGWCHLSSWGATWVVMSCSDSDCASSQDEERLCKAHVRKDTMPSDAVSEGQLGG